MLTAQETQSFITRLAAAETLASWLELDRELRARPDVRDADVIAMIKMVEAKSGPTVFAAMGRLSQVQGEALMAAAQNGDDLDAFVQQQNGMAGPMQVVMAATRTSVLPQDPGLADLWEVRSGESFPFREAALDVQTDRQAREHFEGTAEYRAFRDRIVAAGDQAALAAVYGDIAAALGDGEEREAWRAEVLTPAEQEMLKEYATDRMWHLAFLMIQQVHERVPYAELVAMQETFNQGPAGQMQVAQRLEEIVAEIEGREPRPDLFGMPPEVLAALGEGIAPVGDDEAYEDEDYGADPLEEVVGEMAEGPQGIAEAPQEQQRALAGSRALAALQRLMRSERYDAALDAALAETLNDMANQAEVDGPEDERGPRR